MEMIVTLIRLVYHDATLVRLELKNTDAILLDVLHHMMFIENSFQTTELTWILSLGKKFKLYEFEEKPLTLWKKQSTWISCHPDGD